MSPRDKVHVFVMSPVPDFECFLNHISVCFWYKSCSFAIEVDAFSTFVTEQFVRNCSASNLYSWEGAPFESRPEELPWLGGLGGGGCRGFTHYV
jgi:hypothetical protein